MSEVASLVPMYPSVHAQADRLVLAAGELAFAPHGRHDVASSVVEYVPALHSVHAPLSSAKLPTPQFAHKPASAAPWFAVVLPAGHAMHSRAAVAWTYFPALHGVHIAEPSVDEYLPATQFVHNAEPESQLSELD